MTPSKQQQQPTLDLLREVASLFERGNLGTQNLLKEVVQTLDTLAARADNPSESDLKKLKHLEEYVSRLEHEAKVFRQVNQSITPISLAKAHILLLSGPAAFVENQNEKVLITWAKDEIKNLLGDGIRTITFLPYALEWEREWHEEVRKQWQALGYELDFITRHSDPVEAIKQAEAIYIEGGSTPTLLRRLYENELIPPIRAAVESGVPFIGSSAGSNVAMREISTTNDMPIVDIPSRQALHLLPFALNPHFLDPDPTSKHCGETRDDRIHEYHQLNSTTVLGLREGGVLRVNSGKLEFKDIVNQDGTMRMFVRGQEPKEIKQGDLTALLLGS